MSGVIFLFKCVVFVKKPLYLKNYSLYNSNCIYNNNIAYNSFCYTTNNKHFFWNFIFDALTQTFLVSVQHTGKNIWQDIQNIQFK